MQLSIPTTHTRFTNRQAAQARVDARELLASARIRRIEYKRTVRDCARLADVAGLIASIKACRNRLALTNLGDTIFPAQLAAIMRAELVRRGLRHLA